MIKFNSGLNSFSLWRQKNVSKVRSSKTICNSVPKPLKEKINTRLQIKK